MRPHPPEILTQEEYVGIDYFIPSPELDLWVRKTFFASCSPLYNEDHIHLTKAHIGYLWTNVPNVKKMRVVAGEAEKPMFKGGAWQKHRQEMQFQEWFGDIPDFVITLSASFANQTGDRSFCALIEHELYHCAQAVDEFNQPRFNQDTGQPIFAMRGHDTEQFVGVVRRYGKRAARCEELVEAANQIPIFDDESDISIACGSM